MLENQKKEILFGCLLGDASLQTYTGGKSWRARFIQGENHKEYLFHLYDIFKDWVKTPPRCITDKHGSTRWYFNTIVQEELLFMAKYFYSKNSINGGAPTRSEDLQPLIENTLLSRFPQKKIKVIPPLPFLEEYLTPRALAYWFMDDGSLKINASAYYLCTDHFNLKELKVIHGYLKNRYGWELAYHKKGKSYRLYIPVRFSSSFRETIEKYVHPSMYYKLFRKI